MAFKRLQIKHLSPRGELLRCINCPAGRITVLRAASGTDLSQFQRALAGIPGPERFSLTIDNEPFEQNRHFFIGFGEHFSKSDSMTVGQYLTKAGVPESQITSTLLSFELEELESTPCSALGADQERRLRFLAALQSTGWIVVLNEPFEDLSSKWKERFAELLTSYAGRQGGLVVISSLSYRPKSWIENEVINRVQVGENLQKTIGFQSGASDVTDLIKQLRESVGEEALSSLSLERPGQPPASARLSKSEHEETVPEETAEFPVYSESSALHHPDPVTPKSLLFFGILGIGVLAAGYWYAFGGGPIPSAPSQIGEMASSTAPEKPAETQQLAALTEVAREVAVTQESAPTATPSMQSKTQEELLALLQERKINPKTVPPPIERTTAHSFVDDYPPRIRKAVFQAFEIDAQHGTRNRTPSRETEQKDKELAGDNLFKLLEQTSGSGEGITSAPPNDRTRAIPPPPSSRAISPADLEKRRELIRQKFLEAIERSSQR